MNKAMRCENCLKTTITTDHQNISTAANKIVKENESESNVGRLSLDSSQLSSLLKRRMTNGYVSSQVRES